MSELSYDTQANDDEDQSSCDAGDAQPAKMNAYEMRREARRARRAEAAERTRNEAQSLLGRASSMADMIPFGQPILVGHYSEKRDRRFRARIGDTMRKGIAARRKADELERRAASVGSGGISSDDPAAVRKLREELAKLEALQERMKSANRCVRRNDRVGLAALGFSERHIDELFTPDFVGRLGFPSYAITNNGTNMRRIKQRIEDIEKRDQTPASETLEGEGWSITESVEENRIIIRLDEKPSRDILATLRQYGFKWSPTRGAHVRMRSNGALYAAKRVLGVNA